MIDGAPRTSVPCGELFLLPSAYSTYRVWMAASAFPVRAFTWWSVFPSRLLRWSTGAFCNASVLTSQEISLSMWNMSHRCAWHRTRETFFLVFLSGFRNHFVTKLTEGKNFPDDFVFSCFFIVIVLILSISHFMKHHGWESTYKWGSSSRDNRCCLVGPSKWHHGSHLCESHAIIKWPAFRCRALRKVRYFIWCIVRILPYSSRSIVLA